MSSEYRRLISQLRSQNLTGSLQRRLDMQARMVVAYLGSQFEFAKPVETYQIALAAWEHVHNLRLNPVSVFCHPSMLMAEPFVSLYYRGISGLSLKEVQNQARSVINWEAAPDERQRKPRVTAEAAGQVAGLYNSVISSVIENTLDWTLENGYRNIIASLGITCDGSMRNTVGRLPERRIRRLLLQYVYENAMLLTPEYPDADSIPVAPANGEYVLRDNFVMVFSSKPDIGFRRGNLLEATIEVKGGIDPAGALERLGAAEKSAQAAIEVNRRCKKFLVAGVITSEMRRRLNQSRLFEKHFLLVELLSRENLQSEFFEEIFNHTLRITIPNP